MSNKTTRIAIIGLGSMGMGMAHSLLRAGLDVAGCDISESARLAFVEHGGRVTAAVTEAAKDADCVILVVVNATQTEVVLDETLPVMAKDAVFVSCATVAPAAAEAMAYRVQATGRHYLDAPVSGGSIKASQGEITVMASGSETAFVKAQPVLDAIAAKVYQVGDVAGPGSAMKLINQLLTGVHIAATCEAMALAIKLNLDPGTVHDVITHAAGTSWVFENRVPRILEGDYEPRSTISIFVKDMGIVVDTAHAESFPTPMASTAQQLFLMAAAAAMGDDDDSSVVRLYAQLAGLDLPGQD